MDPIKLPEMSEEEIEDILNRKSLCRIAFIDKDFPYIAPFQYVYINNTLYFHFTDYGKKKRIFKDNKNVCVSLEDIESDLSNFSFITIQAELTEVTNQKEKDQVLKLMATEGKNKFSRNFLAAHGFKKEEGWDILNKKKDLRIFKLINFKKQIGLRSF